MLSKINSEILYFFPDKIKCILQDISKEKWSKAKEIRVRAGQPIIIVCFDEEIVINYVVDTEDVIRLIENFSENSIYSIQNEINNGFITIKGGHRIGVSGTSIIESEKVKNIKYISSLNIRIAREIKNCSLNVLEKIANDKFENTLIISPPGCGKTTMLRDMIRLLSNGIGFIKGSTIGLVDERSEIAAMYKGIPQNDIGIRTDVMNNCLKHIGMKMMIRSMGPNIIATDEIGSREDVLAIEEAVCSGIKLLLTAHGNSLKDIPKELLDKRVFNNVILLSNNNMPGSIEKICVLESDKYVVNS